MSISTVKKFRLSALFIALTAGLSACGSDGDIGQTGAEGAQGLSGTDGANGQSFWPITMLSSHF